MSVQSYESYSLQWMQREGNDEFFRKIYRIVLIASILLALIVTFISVPKPERKEREPLPPRMVKFLEEQKKAPPPKPVVAPKPKPVEKPKPIERPKPKPKEPQTAKESKARDTAKKSGLLALSSELADLIETPSVSALASSSVSTKGQQAVKNDTSVLTANVTKGSGGVSTKGLNRNVSTTAINGRTTTQVQSSAAAATIKSAQGSGSKSASRSEEEITIVMDRNKGAIYAVYNRELRRNPGLQGRVVLEITIAPSGQVTKVKIVSSELNDKKLEAKLVARIKLFNFGAKKVDTVTVTYPLEFFPS